ncbi:gp39 [Burkholderia pseudomallei]|uniref:hypothetical protein n=1 Tax=Burkholderia pseudomallei TaxID=28450 RepID=UPI000F197F08|nr:hypothetical protein [Burkholderia pseudomallei]CAJ2900730.1 gp39 [Burkholderia pseudomallei]VCG48316.1 gp39 [Burkholderia pseudomallei]VCG67522.1 gp39 [Burkholderia pseudomallei]VCG69790.1 gp39 [Burkholderia pseudomallei]VCG73384.1 gp39 [Burkholderia pseudomallei]
MTTTDKSRADALTDDQFEDWLLPLLIKHLDSKARHYLTREQVRDGIEVTRVTTYAMNLARAILAASPVEQPAAAPIDDARKCLMDVVSHHDSIVAGFAAQRLAAEEAQDSDAAAYWKHESDVAHRMKAQAERALAAMAQPAPAPAEERAAFVERVMGMFEAWPNGKPGPTDEPESHYRFGYNTALEDVLTALDVGSPTRRAASANETAAEGAQKEAVMLLLQARDELCLIEWEGEDPPERIHTLFDKIEAFVTRSPAMAAEALAEEHSTIECQAHSGPDCTECGGTGVWSGKADERAASWHCEDPVQKCRAQCDSCAKQARAALKAIVDERAECIAWANANGFTKYHESMCAAWEERARRAAQQLSAEIAELKIKLVSYEREREDQIRYLAAQSEEIAGLKQQLAHADARVGLTATVIQKCIDSCAAEYLEDVTGHPEDAAYCQGITDCIDALNRLKTADWSAILAAHSGQSEPETATVARIEKLRKALFESRDAMRVMSNWVKKSDPAGHSWAVRMVDRANAALNGEPEPRSEVTDDDKLCAERYRWLRERAWYVDAATYALELRERWRSGNEPLPDVDEVECALDAARTQRGES